MPLSDLSDIDLEKARHGFQRLCYAVGRDIIRMPSPAWDHVVEAMNRTRYELAREVSRRRGRK